MMLKACAFPPALAGASLAAAPSLHKPRLAGAADGLGFRV